jgi:hypothetical protein
LPAGASKCAVLHRHPPSFASSELP